MPDWTPFTDALTGVYAFLMPEMILCAVAAVMFLGGTFTTNRNTWFTVSLLAIVGAFFTLHPSTAYRPVDPAVYAAPVLNDALAVFVKGVALAAGAVLILFSWSEVRNRQAADYYACLLLLLAGLCLVGTANDLITMFLALELISIPTYVLLYLPRHDSAAQEAALKYFLLSVFSSALLLFGFSYLYGLAGTTNVPALFYALQQTDARDVPAFAQIAVIMVLAGLGFRMTAVPFHFYAPDVYQGTSTVLAAMLAFVPKVAGFVAVLRLLGFVLPTGVAAPSHLIGMSLSTQTPILLWFLAAVTMSLGNLFALLQDNLKRLLAYSSVAHAGYMLVALAAAPYLRENAAGGPDGVQALLVYLVAYGVMTIGVFAVIAYVDTPQQPVETVDDLAGLSRSHPGAALAMTLFLFSLTGIPLTIGFAGKFLIFLGAMGVNSADHDRLFHILALVAAVNAAIGGWYYLRIVAVMYLRGPVNPPATRWAPGLLVLLWICAIATIALTLPPASDWLMQTTRTASGIVQQ